MCKLRGRKAKAQYTSQLLVRHIFTGCEFECAAGDCVPLSSVCDGVSNCSDSTDETECGKT